MILILGGPTGEERSVGVIPPGTTTTRRELTSPRQTGHPITVGETSSQPRRGDLRRDTYPVHFFHGLFKSVRFWGLYLCSSQWAV